MMVTRRSHRRAPELEKSLRLSWRVLPIATTLAGSGIAVLWVVRSWLAFPAWVAVLLTALLLFAPVGDALNILYARRALRQIDDGRHTRLK